jgi:hypothetical protein
MLFRARLDPQFTQNLQVILSHLRATVTVLTGGQGVEWLVLARNNMLAATYNPSTHTYWVLVVMTWP